MPFTLNVTGTEELLSMLRKLEDRGAGIASEALYEGAGVVADAVSGAVQGIATKPFRYAAGWQRMPSPEEKALLVNARHGVAKFKKTKASVQTSVGLQNSGYGEIAGRTKPVPLIANAIESGTYFMQKQPFFRSAVSQAATAAATVIESEIQKKVNDLNLDE